MARRAASGLPRERTSQRHRPASRRTHPVKPGTTPPPARDRRSRPSFTFRPSRPAGATGRPPRVGLGPRPSAAREAPADRSLHPTKPARWGEALWRRRGAQPPVSRTAPQSNHPNAPSPTAKAPRLPHPQPASISRVRHPHQPNTRKTPSPRTDSLESAIPAGDSPIPTSNHQACTPPPPAKSPETARTAPSTFGSPAPTSCAGHAGRRQPRDQFDPSRLRNAPRRGLPARRRGWQGAGSQGRSRHPERLARPERPRRRRR